MRFLIPLAMVLALSACKTIKVENGEVPDDYRAMAQAYMGTYSGSMSGVAGTLTLSFQGRKVVVAYKDANGTDILDARCDSKIDDLLSVNVSKDHALDKGSTAYKLDSATFAFDPNRCWGSVEGHELVLDFTKKSGHVRVDASLLVREDFERNCRIDPGNPRSGIPPHEICDQVPRDTYATGRFQK